MARSVDEFYGTGEPPLPVGVRPVPAADRLDATSRHPGVVLSVNPLNTRLGHVAVIPVTGTPGPEQTRVPLTADAGLTRDEESYADVTALQPVARSRLLTRRGLLTHAELERLGRCITDWIQPADATPACRMGWTR